MCCILVQNSTPTWYLILFCIVHECLKEEKKNSPTKFYQSCVTYFFFTFIGSLLNWTCTFSNIAIYTICAVEFIGPYPRSICIQWPKKTKQKIHIVQFLATQSHVVHGVNVMTGPTFTRIQWQDTRDIKYENRCRSFPGFICVYFCTILAQISPTFIDLQHCIYLP